MKSLADCNDVSSRKTSEIVKYDGLYGVLMRFGSANSDSHGKLFVKNVTKVL